MIFILIIVHDGGSELFAVPVFCIVVLSIITVLEGVFLEFTIGIYVFPLTLAGCSHHDRTIFLEPASSQACFPSRHSGAFLIPVATRKSSTSLHSQSRCHVRDRCLSSLCIRWQHSGQFLFSSVVSLPLIIYDRVCISFLTHYVSPLPYMTQAACKQCVALTLPDVNITI